MLGMLALLLLTWWLVRKTFAYMQPHAEQIFSRVLDWSRRHPVLGKVTGALVDPRYPESPALIFLAGMLLLAGLIFFTILINVTGTIEPGGFDNTAHSLMQSLRGPWMDTIMVGITMLGDTLVYGILSLAILVWLLWQRNIPAAIHWVAAIAFGGIMTRVLKVSLQIPRPNDLIAGTSGFSFPSAHATMSMVVYGFLAVLIARELEPRGRRIIYVGSSLLIMSIAFSRLYLGVHWVTDIVGGLTLGFAWVSLLGIAYRRHISPLLPVAGFATIGILTLVAVAVPHIYLNHSHEMQQYEQRYPEKLVEGAQWWSTEWEQLPTYRNDLGVTDHHPMNLQWTGSITALQNELKKHGWKEPKTLDVGSFFQWLNPNAILSELPILPHVHEGRHQDLLLVHPANTTDKQWVIRLWKTNIILTPSQQTLWIGNASTQTIQHAMGILNYPATTKDFNTPLSVLISDFESYQKTIKHRVSAKSAGNIQWNGNILLIDGASKKHKEF
jgi:undecaprenyl-diphosphatase